MRVSQVENRASPLKPSKRVKARKNASCMTSSASWRFCVKFCAKRKILRSCRVRSCSKAAGSYEKFSAIAVTNPHVLEQVGTIVIDEVQMIADENRGANLEF